GSGRGGGTCGLAAPMVRARPHDPAEALIPAHRARLTAHRARTGTAPRLSGARPGVADRRRVAARAALGGSENARRGTQQAAQRAGARTRTLTVPQHRAAARGRTRPGRAAAAYGHHRRGRTRPRVGALRMAELYRLPANSGVRAGGVCPTVVMGLTMTCVLSVWAATEVAAYRWSFSPVLGRPMAAPDRAHAGVWTACAMSALLAALLLVCVRGVRAWAVPTLFLAAYCYALGAWPLYAPWQILVWWARYHWSPETAPLWEDASWTMAVVATCGTVGTIAAAVQRAKQIGARSDLYGSAEFGTPAQLQQSGLLSGEGLYVGMWPVRRRGRTTMVAL